MLLYLCFSCNICVYAFWPKMLACLCGTMMSTPSLTLFWIVSTPSYTEHVASMNCSCTCLFSVVLLCPHGVGQFGHGCCSLVFVVGVVDSREHSSDWAQVFQDRYPDAQKLGRVIGIFITVLFFRACAMLVAPRAANSCMFRGATKWDNNFNEHWEDASFTNDRIRYRQIILSLTASS